MQTKTLSGRNYWKEAMRQFSKTDTLAVATAITALRVIVKLIKIPIAAGLYITFDCYVNAIGSFIYGPLVGLAVGAISDTIGAILLPTGDYFLPFILVEMSSSFIFGLFLWKKPLTVTRTVLSKFAVNFFCNIILNSIFMKWYYHFFGIDAVYPFINLVRIVKNLILFPIEGLLIAAVIQAVIPALKSLSLISKDTNKEKITVKHIILILGLILISSALVLFYVFFLNDYLANHNIKLF